MAKFCLCSLDSNEVELLVILEALRIFFESFQGTLAVKSDSSNAANWILRSEARPWEFLYDV